MRSSRAFEKRACGLNVPSEAVVCVCRSMALGNGSTRYTLAHHRLALSAVEGLLGAGRDLVARLALDAVAGPGHHFQAQARNRFLAIFAAAEPAFFDFPQRRFDSVEILLFGIGDIKEQLFSTDRVAISPHHRFPVLPAGTPALPFCGARLPRALPASGSGDRGISGSPTRTAPFPPPTCPTSGGRPSGGDGLENGGFSGRSRLETAFLTRSF